MSQLRWRWLPSFLVKAEEENGEAGSEPYEVAARQPEGEEGPVSFKSWRSRDTNAAEAAGAGRRDPSGGHAEVEALVVRRNGATSESADGDRGLVTRSQSNKETGQHPKPPLFARSQTTKVDSSPTSRSSTSRWSGSGFDSSLFTSSGATTWLLGHDNEASPGQRATAELSESTAGLPPPSPRLSGVQSPDTVDSRGKQSFAGGPASPPENSQFGLSRGVSFVSDVSSLQSSRRLSEVEDDALSKQPSTALDQDVLTRSSVDTQGGATSAGAMTTPRTVTLQRMAEAATGALLESLDSFKVNLAREEEHAQLTMALAKRVADQANQATEDGPSTTARFQLTPAGEGISQAEAMSFRYWMNNTLSYDERVVDGFYEIWGMSPHIWTMCTDFTEHGRIPSLERLREVPPSETQFEVIMVDRKNDEELAILEDKAVGIAYAAQDVCTLAHELGKLVSQRLGGPLSNEDELAEDWRSDSWELKGILGSIVLPLGRLRVGLCRHRALLFKVLADSMGLPCRLVRGCSYCKKDDGASSLVLFEEREYVVDLLSKPGILVAPELPQSAPSHFNIRSPLQFVPRTGSSTEPSTTTSNDNRRSNSLRRTSAGREASPGGRRRNSFGEDRTPEGGTPPNSKEHLRHMPSIGEGGSKGGGSGSSTEGRLKSINERRSSREKNAALLALENEKHQADLEEWEIPWEDLQIGERIGAGSYGKVFHADWQGSDVAVKVFLDQDFREEAIRDFKAEFAIIRRLRHPNVVLFMGAVTRPPNLSIVTEFLPRGSLYRLLHRTNSAQVLDEKRRMRMAMDICKGMNYLHRSNPPIVHRDLKSPNLLVDKNWTVKVCDFGLSRLKNATFLTSKSGAGTPEWMAPEVLRNEPSDEKCDVYSFGVILWELALLEQPWANMNPMQVVGAVGFQNRRLPLPDTIDPAVKSIIQACWANNPRQRPSFADLMASLKPLQKPISSAAS